MIALGLTCNISEKKKAKGSKKQNHYKYVQRLTGKDRRGKQICQQRNTKHKKEIGTLGLRIIIPEIKLNTKSGLPTARVRQEDARGHRMEPPEVGRSVRRGKTGGSAAP